MLVILAKENKLFIVPQYCINNLSFTKNCPMEDPSPVNNYFSCQFSIHWQLDPE